MTRTVAFCSKAEFDKLVFTEPTIIFTLDDAIAIPREAIEHDKGEHVTWHRVPCKVLSCGRDFTPTDAQARLIGNFMKATIKPDADIVIHCTNGELRSPAVAYGVVALTSGSLTTYRNGVAIEKAEEELQFDIFQGRTAMEISRILDGEIT